MTAYRRVYDSRHLQADCQEPGSAPERSVIEHGLPLGDLLTVYYAERLIMYMFTRQNSRQYRETETEIQESKIVKYTATD